jgi:hypothetical protein
LNCCKLLKKFPNKIFFHCSCCQALKKKVEAKWHTSTVAYVSEVGEKQQISPHPTYHCNYYQNSSYYRRSLSHLLSDEQFILIMDTFKCPSGWTGRTKRIPLFIVIYGRPGCHLSLITDCHYFI